jgi:hypothetical protein
MKLSKESIMSMIEDQVSIPSARMKHRTKLHIAVVLKRGKVLEVAVNKIGSRSNGCGYTTYTMHAERAVLKKIGDVAKLEGATLVVIRLARGSTTILNSEPCHSCRCHLEKCIKEYGLKSVYYSV